MTAPRHTIEVVLAERGYSIEIGVGTLPGAGQFLRRRTPAARAVVITDEHVEQPHALTVADSMTAANVDVDVIVLDAGESAKCVDVALELWNKLLELGVDRGTVIVAVGGGVIGDLAGFVAATYARGLAYMQVPTTLLAQVDSSVGGKTGINLEGAKNIVGAFWQPLGVLIDPDVLRTLPDREYRSGLAEVVKYGMILDAEFFAYLERHAEDLAARDVSALGYAIAKSCELKALVVTQDERELTGVRAVLNYGHTFCHAFETLTGYQTLLHGEAVAMGMHCAAVLAERLGRIDRSLTERQERLLARLGLATRPPQLDPADVICVMGRDKKAEQGKLRFVLPSELGRVELAAGIDPAAVRAALQDAAQ